MKTAVKIGSAYGFVKQHVARNQQFRLGTIKDDMSRRMTRNMQHLKGIASDRERFAFFEPTCRRKGGRDGKSVLRGGLRQRLEQEFIVRMWPEDGNVTRFQHLDHAACMIEMAVCQPDCRERKFAVCQLLQQERHVAADIGQDGFAAFVVPNQGAVLAEGGNGEDFVT